VKTTKAYFNEKADSWDSKAAEKDKLKLQHMADRLYIKSGATVIDVGTGTGIFLPYLLQKTGIYGKIIALDIAEMMLLKAKSKHIAVNIDFICSDVVALPFPDEICDAVVCYSCLPHFSNKLQAILEMKRALKRGGQVFFCHTSSRQSINEIHRSQPELCAHLFPENDEVRQMLIEAGFTDIRISEGENDYLAAARRISN